MSHPIDKVAEREKRQVALSSVLAAVFLTTIKIIIGLATNSLGILSEAAHSGLDMIAAGVTYFAVRVSDKPPDHEHQYGHGKVENLAALIETFLLLATCVWIVYEAVSRLIDPVDVKASFWSFAVMGTSIVIDITRSRALMKTAKKYNSQALEADAIHFSTDVWSSSVVIIGLAAVWMAQRFVDQSSPLIEWLLRADALAALGVSGIVVYVSIKLGRRTIDALLDTTKKETSEQIERTVRRIPGVSAVRRVRVRHSGPATFVDIALNVPRSASFEEAYETAAEVEKAIARLFPRTDVMVSIAPVIKDESSLVEVVRSVAARQGVSVHGIRIYDVLGKISLELHVEVSERLTLEQAHERATLFENVLREEIQTLKDVVTHIEPVGDKESHYPAEKTSSEGIYRAVSRLPNLVEDVMDCHSINILRDASGLSVSFHCRFDPNIPIGKAHHLTEELENLLRTMIPELGSVIIHPEPYKKPPDVDEEKPNG